MKKIILFILFLFYILLPKSILSAGEFSSDVNVEYFVLDGGITRVTHDITVENLFTNLYATSYNLTLENINPTNVKTVYNGREIEHIIKNRDKFTDITINFNDAVVGKGKKRNFQVIYDNASFAQKTGEVWEISIPKLSFDSDFRNYSLTFSVPESFGLEAYISPKPLLFEKTSGRYVYKYNKNTVTQIGITAGFGAAQVFSFTLNYHLENPVSKQSEVNIAVPPDTNLQKVYYSSIDPSPYKVEIDSDGNWIAKYLLKPRERLDIKVDGTVQIFSGQRNFPKPTDEMLLKYLNPSEYWNSESEKIREIALNNKTPKEIYDFVINTLSYSYEKVTPENKRLGSIQALMQPNNATCMEFTDLFIAIARAAGIPARELNGFAYTENPKIQPLSLVNDVLHSWPEYWDFNKQQWIQIDPTWASTTGGVDYFNKLDLRHFVFVIHGLDSLKPYTPGSYKLGPNPQKDIFVNFGSLPELKSPQIKLSYKLLRNIPFTSTLYEVEIFNEGPTALYGFTPDLIFDGAIEEQEYFEVLPPFGKVYFNVSIPYSILGRHTPNIAEVSLLGESISLKTYKNRVITDTLLVLLIFIILIILVLIIRLKPKIILNTWYKIVCFIKNDKNNIQTKKDQDIKN
jgi:hypothetical protein